MLGHIWQTVSKGDQVTLLCDGISNNESSSDGDTDTEMVIPHGGKWRTYFREYIY